MRNCSEIYGLHERNRRKLTDPRPGDVPAEVERAQTALSTPDRKPRNGLGAAVFVVSGARQRERRELLDRDPAVLIPQPPGRCGLILHRAIMVTAWTTLRR